MPVRLDGFDLLAVVDVVGACGAKGIAPHAGQDDADPDWQPL